MAEFDEGVEVDINDDIILLDEAVPYTEDSAASVASDAEEEEAATPRSRNITVKKWLMIAAMASAASLAVVVGLGAGIGAADKKSDRGGKVNEVYNGLSSNSTTDEDQVMTYEKCLEEADEAEETSLFQNITLLSTGEEGDETYGAYGEYEEYEDEEMDLFQNETLISTEEDEDEEASSIQNETSSSTTMDVPIARKLTMAVSLFINNHQNLVRGKSAVGGSNDEIGLDAGTAGGQSNRVLRGGSSNIAANKDDNKLLNISYKRRKLECEEIMKSHDSSSTEEVNSDRSRSSKTSKKSSSKSSKSSVKKSYRGTKKSSISK